MASFSTRTNKDGSTVHKVEIRLRGQYASRTFDRLGDAITWAEDTEEVIKAGGYITEAPAGDMVFKTALDKYMAEISTTKKQNTQAREKTAAKPLHEFFDSFLLSEISMVLVAKYRDRRLVKIGPSSLQKELALLSHMLNIARKEWPNLENIKNPVPDVRRPAPPKNRLRVLSHDEIRHFLNQCKQSENNKLETYVLVMFHTAMRPSECAGLTWSQLDLDTRIADLTVTKTDPRRVPLTVAAVKKLLELQGEEPPGCQTKIFLPPDHSARIRQRPNLYFRRAYDNAVDKAGLGSFTMHDLRHTAASHMLMSGKVDLRSLAAIMGHKSMDMVMRYTHFLDRHLVATVDNIERLGL
nr:integrase [bacterium]